MTEVRERSDAHHSTLCPSPFGHSVLPIPNYFRTPHSEFETSSELRIPNAELPMAPMRACFNAREEAAVADDHTKGDPLGHDGALRGEG
jgi:hypothetical protein